MDAIDKMFITTVWLHFLSSKTRQLFILLTFFKSNSTPKNIAVEFKIFEYIDETGTELGAAFHNGAPRDVNLCAIMAK